jgi:hypothetical protein
MFSIETIGTPKAGRGREHGAVKKRVLALVEDAQYEVMPWRYRAVLLTTVRINPAKFQRFVPLQPSFCHCLHSPASGL